MQQARLIPKFVQMLTAQIFYRTCAEFYLDVEEKLNAKIPTEEDNMAKEEWHLLTTCIKVYSSEHAKEALNESRAACGGLGFSKYAGFGEHIGFNDVNRTWEGDNHVLSQ